MVKSLINSKEEAIEMYKEGHSMDEIADELGITKSTVGTYVYSSGISSDFQVREVRARAYIRRLIEKYEKEFGVIFKI